MTDLQAKTTKADTTKTPPRRVEGRVVLGTRAGQKPVVNQWVILHRVGTDRAAPMDSVRTNTTGGFLFRYRPTGDTTALYFVSTSYGGVAYFTPPLRSPVVYGDAASMTVFDTTSGPVAVRIGGRHLIVGAPLANGRRPIGEVYDLQNDSTVTVIARNGTTPVWATHIPAAAAAFQINSSGEIAQSGMSREGTTVNLFVPISPGIRQFAFTYELPQSAFPLKIPTEQPTGVFEVLVQDPTAHVQGPGVKEVAPVTTEGRTFRRFLAQDLPPNSVMQVDVPRILGAGREKVYIGVSVAIIAAMAAALLLTARRSFSRVRMGGVGGAEVSSEMLLRSIASLDAEFERAAAPSAAARAAYETRRRELKVKLMRLVEGERGGRK